MHGVLSQAACFQVHAPVEASRRTSCRLRFGWWGGPNISRRVAASTSGGASRQYSWMQHPSLPRGSAQIDPRRIPEGPIAHGLSRTSRGVSILQEKMNKGPHSSKGAQSKVSSYDPTPENPLQPGTFAAGILNRLLAFGGNRRELDRAPWTF